jgi:hypothetical protein
VVVVGGGAGTTRTPAGSEERAWAEAGGTGDASLEQDRAAATRIAMVAGEELPAMPDRP